MRLVTSRALSGDPATLIEIETAADYDVLLRNIVDTGYYDSAYFQRHSGYQPGRHVAHFWLLAEGLSALAPRRVLELGCGRGDMLSILAARGCEVSGVDSSADAVAAAWPNVRAHLSIGRIEDLDAPAGAFDLVLGLDVWEHLHPASLDGCLERVTGAASLDALMFCVVPAFGRDRLFGEQFPLEFEENRDALARDEPFRFLTTEVVSPPIPAAGHLIWAGVGWWERRFTAHGWVRVGELEGLIRAFDPFVPHSVRSAFLFRRDTPEARDRVARAAGTPVAPRVVAGLARAAREDPVEALRRWVIPRLPDGLRATWRRLRSF